MNLLGTQWCVLHCRQHALCCSYWASLSFSFCNPNEVSGKWQDLSFPNPPHELLQLSEPQVTKQKPPLAALYISDVQHCKNIPAKIHWLMTHFPGWASPSRCNEAALPNALPMEPLFAMSFWSRPTSFIHKRSWDVWWTETPWASAGFQCCCFSSSLQCITVQRGLGWDWSNILQWWFSA